MARKKKNDIQTIDPTSEIISKVEKDQYPKVTQGSHSTFIEHENSRVEYIVDWDKLGEEINLALTNHQKLGKIVKNKPLRVKKTKDEA